MPSSPLGSTHGRMTSRVASHHRLLIAHTVQRRRAWHAITAFGQHTRSNKVGHDMPSPPLDNTHGRTMSGVACHHRLWAAQRYNNVGRFMPSSPLGSTNGGMTSGVHAITALALHAQSDDVERGMTSPPLESTHSQTASGVACHHRLWGAHTVERRRTWHAIITFG